MGVPAHRSEEMFLVEGGGHRPILSDPARDDAKQVLALAVAGIQRERAAADQTFMRGRNFLAFTATLFFAVQAAFIANVGRESQDKLLLSSAERTDLMWWAAIAAAGVLAALGMLLFWLDRPRKIQAVGGDTLLDAWFDPEKKYGHEAVLETLAGAAIQEEQQWADANKSRKRAVAWIGLTCAAVAITALIELVVLYVFLT